MMKDQFQLFLQTLMTPRKTWFLLVSLMSSLSLSVVFTGCLQCLGSPFTFQYKVNGVLTADDSSVQAPALVEMFASEQFEPTCGQSVVVTKVAFYAGSQLLAVDTSAPFSYTWSLVAGKDGVPSSGRAKITLYALANDTFTSATPKLEIIVTPLGNSTRTIEAKTVR